MDTVYARVSLGNLLRADPQPVEIDALVDSAAINLCILDVARRELELEVMRTRVAEMADGSFVEIGVGEPVTVTFGNRVTTTTAMVRAADPAARSTQFRALES